MVAFPFLLALIFPLLLTVATFLLEVLYVNLSFAVSGKRFTLRVRVSPFFSTADFSENVSLVVFTVFFCTFTLQLALAPLFIVTVIIAVPVFFFAVSLPVRGFTATMRGLEEVHS